jgi:protein-S-isoprenylcysteine O-methyltransferase Ste14
MQPLLRAFPFNLLMLAGCGAVAWATAQADAQMGLPSLAHPAGMAVGALLVALGLRLRLLATIAYYRHELAVVRLRPQQRLVTSGVFAHLRNPLLQGWWMLQAGWGVALGTPAGLLLALALGIVLDFWVKWEELTLAAKFGDKYVAYRARTPRWGWQR